MYIMSEYIYIYIYPVSCYWVKDEESGLWRNNNTIPIKTFTKN